jgi:short-subunit dehydrogenase
MQVNLRAPLLLTRAALPHFRRHGAGRVLNIGSVNSYCGDANLLAYAISKGD